MALKEKLEKLKNLAEKNNDADWVNYKQNWQKSIEELYNTIMNNWLADYEEENLMKFEIISSKRNEPYIGEYLTSILEITLSENKFLVLDPISAITAEYDGKLDLYMLGNISNKVSILRIITENNSCEWIVVKSYDAKDRYKFDKVQLEKLIEEWLQ